MKEPQLKIFKCKVCGQTRFDTNLYFFNTKSSKCLWCTKFPKKKKREFKDDSVA
jgi:hypothetical protein